MRWSRWSGAGNTFLIADARAFPNNKAVDRSALARQICHAFGRAETDGLLVIEPKEGYDFAWDFYNSDGSRAEMCGNAARCAAMYFYRKNNSKKNLEFLTLAGKVGAQIISDSIVRVEMPTLPANFSLVQGHFWVNTGVPHIVIEGAPDAERARTLRPLPNDKGSNITFVLEVSKSGCKAVTFERGVENFTLACGTGAVAAACYLAQKTGGSRFVVEMPGGQLLVDNVIPGKKPFLEGPAEWNYDFEEINL